MHRESVLSLSRDPAAPRARRSLRYGHLLRSLGQLLDAEGAGAFTITAEAGGLTVRWEPPEAPGGERPAHAACLRTLGQLLDAEGADLRQLRVSPSCYEVTLAGAPIRRYGQAQLQDRNHLHALQRRGFG